MGDYLRGKKAYLSGPIEHGDTTDWRIGPTMRLTSEFGIDLFDPFRDPKQQWLPALREARDKKEYDTMSRIAKNFVRKDLCIVDRCDLLIACLPKGIPTTGTVHEIINSNNCKKPTILICPEGKEQIPLWYWGFIPHEFMFGNWDDLYEFLRGVNNDQQKTNDRWAYIYGLI